MEYRNATFKDIPEVSALQQKYHVSTVSEEDKPDGFVTTLFNEEQFKEIIEKENGLFLAIDNNKVSPNANIEASKIEDSLVAVKNRNTYFSINNDGYFEGDNYSLNRYSMRRVNEYNINMDRLFDYRIALDAIKKLNSKEQYIIKKIFLEDKTQKEISKELNCSVAAVGKIKFKALSIIKKDLV